MSFRTPREIEYWLNFKYSLLIALGLMVLIFYLFPRFSPESLSKIPPLQIQIYVTDIPPTRQLEKNISRPLGHSPSSVPLPRVQPSFPAEIPLAETPGTDSSPDTGNSFSMMNSPGTAQAIPVEIPAKPLLEVYPAPIGITCKGYVRVLLLVNRTGRIESLEILENTTLTDTCVSLVREAALKSKWIPAKVKNETVSSWVVKEYKFNLKK